MAALRDRLDTLLCRLVRGHAVELRPTGRGASRLLASTGRCVYCGASLR